MLQLQHQIVNTEDKASTDGRVIVALDLTKAFERLKHEAILRSLQTAQLKVGPHGSPETPTGSTGTSQGSVISAFLFNATMIELANKPQSIDEVHHSIYGDDVTLWTAGGRDGDIQDRLQEAIDAEQKTQGRLQTHMITLRVGETPVPEVAKIRVLGLHLYANGHNGKTVQCLEKTTHQITRLITRIASRHRGMKENTLLRLVYAFIISRITCVASFLPLKQVEKQKINSLIKRAHRQALGIPICVPNVKCEALGVHNTLEELIEAQRIAHLERLTKTATGRHLLNRLRISYR
ncbi:hypothetical protein HPB47_010191 [Ixodes persulcatus]|uniref:Uncharacterized protein n=1 Tax=Ixodes persulcatus TaxID=34615 RepID=A0AC60NZS0_IXOPE|nr:hypothetical protein HPB47_010191 [Ixodes persulcatus]